MQPVPFLVACLAVATFLAACGGPAGVLAHHLTRTMKERRHAC